MIRQKLINFRTTAITKNREIWHKSWFAEKTDKNSGKTNDKTMQ